MLCIMVYCMVYTIWYIPWYISYYISLLNDIYYGIYHGIYHTVYTIWYIPIAAWYIPSKSGVNHEATFQMSIEYSGLGSDRLRKTSEGSKPLAGVCLFKTSGNYTVVSVVSLHNL
jgi:hypothetical protein